MDPFSTGVGLLSLGAKIFGQSKAHREQARLAKQNDANAIFSFVQNVRALNLRGIQEVVASSQGINSAREQVGAAGSLARTSAAESGVSGRSVQAQALAFDSDLSGYTATTQRNLESVLAQLNLEKVGAATSAQSRINQVPMPSTAGTALGIASSAASAINDLLIRTPKTTK